MPAADTTGAGRAAARPVSAAVVEAYPSTTRPTLPAAGLVGQVMDRAETRIGSALTWNR